MAKPKPPKPAGSGKLAAPRAEGADPNTLRVVFGFQHVVRGFDLGEATGEQACGFIDGLRRRSSITWAQIRSLPREKLGGEKISAALKIKPPPTVPEAVHPEMICFRFGGDLERFIGFRNGAVFEVVWIDHSGQAYDHG